MSRTPRPYAGESLGDRPRIAVVGSSRLGNFVVTTPLLRGIRETWPQARVDFLGSAATAELEDACRWIDWRTDVFPMDPDGPPRLPDAVSSRIGEAGGYDLAINCNGFNRGATTLTGLLEPRFLAGTAELAPETDAVPDAAHPYQRLVLEENWTTPEFLARYGEWLTSNYIGELFCRMAFIETDFFRIEVEGRDPGFPVPDVLVHASSTRDAKLWPADRWIATLDWCHARGLSVGLVGTATAGGGPDPSRDPQDPARIEAAIAAHDAVEDLRGRTSPTRLAGALSDARACLSVDSGPLHVAAAVGCPTVAICATDAAGTGASPRDLWMPRGRHVRVTISERTCGTCLANRFRNTTCLEAEPWCQLGVSSGQVVELLEAALRDR